MDLNEQFKYFVEIKQGFTTEEKRRILSKLRVEMIEEINKPFTNG